MYNPVAAGPPKNEEEHSQRSSDVRSAYERVETVQIGRTRQTRCISGLIATRPRNGFVKSSGFATSTAAIVLLLRLR